MATSVRGRRPARSTCSAIPEASRRGCLTWGCRPCLARHITVWHDGMKSVFWQVERKVFEWPGMVMMYKASQNWFIYLLPWERVTSPQPRHPLIEWRPWSSHRDILLHLSEQYKGSTSCGAILSAIGPNGDSPWSFEMLLDQYQTLLNPSTRPHRPIPETSSTLIVKIQ